MFCKYCGNQIADESVFCTYCGQQLNVVKDEAQQQVSVEHKTAKPIPFILMLVVLGWSLLPLWGRVLIFGYGASFADLLCTLQQLAGVIFLAVMAGNGKIRANAYRYSDLAVLCCVWLVVPYITQVLTGGIMGHWYGAYAHYAWSLVHGTVEPALGASSVWVALAIAALDFARRGKRPDKKLLIILGAAILACSLVGVILAPIVARSMGVPAEVLYQTVRAAGLRMMLYWLWPPLVLAVFHYLGTGEMKTWEAVLTLLSLSLASVMLLFLTVVVLRFGIVAACVLDAFVTPIGYLVVFLLRKNHK